MTDEDIYRVLLGDVTIGENYNSPIPVKYRGKEDKTASFGLYYKDDGILRWKDYGFPSAFGNKAGNLVQYLREGFPFTPKGYKQALAYIEGEVRMGLLGQPPTQLKRRRKGDSVPVVLSGESYLDFELDFWHRFDFSENELHYEDIYPLRSMTYHEGGENVFQSIPGNPAFIYWWSRNPASYKLYRPLGDKRDKFRQWNIEGVIEGWNTMIKEYNGTPFDILFINSSTKDRIVTKKAFKGEYVSSINPRGESDRIDLINKKDEINSLAKRVVIIYDADDPGYDGALMLSQLTGWEMVDVRGKLHGQKDIADMKDKTRGNMSYPEIKQTILSLI